MKVKFTKLAALLLAGAALFATGCNDYEVDIQKNADAIASANQQISALQTTLSALQSTHAADVATLNKAISDLQTALNTAVADLTAAIDKKLDKTTFEAAKAELEAAIQGVKDRVKALEDADFQGQLDALSAKVQKLDEEKASKTELAQAVTELTALINGEVAKLDARLQEVEAYQAKLKDEIIPGINAQITALQEKDQSHDQTLAEHAATLETLSKAVEALTALTAGFPEGQTIKQYVDGRFDAVYDYIDDEIANLETSLKEYIQKELEKYVTMEEYKAYKAEVNGRLDVLEAMLKGFDKKEGSVKDYIDGEIDGVYQYIDDEVDALYEYVDDEIEKLTNYVKNEVARLDEMDQKLEEAIKKVDEDLQATKAELEKVKAELKTVKESIRSLVFVPEVYVDGVEAILIQSLKYPTQVIPEEVFDTNEEVAIETGDSVLVSPKVIAKYHVIPSNADISFLDTAKVNFVIRPNDPFKTIRTRAKASEDFNVTGKFIGRDEDEPDVLCFEVEVEGTAATDEYISVVALQLTKENETYTSDYACIFAESLDSLRIAMPADEDYHYRRALEEVAGIANVDAEAGIPTIPVYLDTVNVESCDTSLVYDVPMDLLTITEAHVVAENQEGHQVIDPKKLGLDWNFELVDIEDWAVGAIDEITLDGTNITAGIDAMDLTPVVRASLINDPDTAQIAYIKFYVAPQDFEENQDMGAFEFACLGDTLEVVTDVYEKAGMTEETFLRVYPEFSYETPENQKGYDTVKFDPTTGKLTWEVDAAFIWNNAAVDEEDAPGTLVEKEVVFTNPHNGATFTVTLQAKRAVIKAYKIPIERYIPNYWTENFDFTLYNVAPPSVGETDSTKCVFVNNINASFYTDAEGVIDLEGIGMPDIDVTNIEYFFCKEMEGIANIDGIEVEFTVNEKGDSLFATVKPPFVAADTTECIAVIDNAYTEIDKTPNVVVLQKESDVAKLLLNTCPGLDDKGNPLPGELYILLGANGTICGEETQDGFKVNLLWKEDKDGEWLDHFSAKYRQPVLLADGAADVFIDAVDFGEGGSFMTIKDLINPMDWRARFFDPQKDENFVVKPGQVDGIDYFSNYWEYYGDIKIFIDTTAIKCTLGFNGEEIDLPVTVDVKVVETADDLKDMIVNVNAIYRDKDGKPRENADGDYITINDYIDSLNPGEFGFLIYHNNLTNVTKDFDLHVPVTLRYGWGVLEKIITVHVYKTPESFMNR